MLVIARKVGQTLLLGDEIEDALADAIPASGNAPD